MRLLLDTQLLVWLSGAIPGTPSPNSAETLRLVEDPDNELYFSSVAVWEVAIKNVLGRPGFRLDPHVFRRGLLGNGYSELAITSEHAAGVGSLPKIHKDPFDRILIAQAQVEGLLLLTADETLARYPGPIRLV